MLYFSGLAHTTWRSGQDNVNVPLAFLPVLFDCPLLMARKDQATSELPERLSAFVSSTQSQIEASRAEAEWFERNITALLAKLDQQEERQKDVTAALQQQLAAATCTGDERYPRFWATQLPSTAARSTIRTLSAWFCRLGIPTTLRSDGGPPFNSHDFSTFLDRWSVTHAPSSPHYPQSNGHAEANVKKVKFLLCKTAPDGDIASTAFQQRVLELRNTPDASGGSPAQIVFGQPLRSTVPAHHSSFATEWSAACDRIDQRAADHRDATIRTYNRSRKPLGPLQLGTFVRLQNPHTKLWDKVATIVSIGQHRTCRIRLDSGRVLWRNRRFPRAIPPTIPPAPTPPPDAENQSSDTTSDPRRSTRTRHAPRRLTM